MISKHCIRTSIALGAIIQESQRAGSKADFLHNLSVALKDAHNPEYRIGLLIALGISEQTETSEIATIMKNDVKMLSEVIKSK